ELNNNNNNNEYSRLNEIVKKEFENLFKTSFFVNQVQKMKSFNSPRISYTFLNESHRFSGKILKIVNYIYKNDESLKSINCVNTNKYNLNINNKNLNSELVMLDILNDKEYFLKYHQDILNDWSKSFDQSGKCIPLKNSEINILEQSTYNQYSALIIVDVIKKILEQNKEKFNNKETKIGVITLTKAQKNIVKFYLHELLENKNDLKNVKVDTIDNFQGREEEIVIVDFIRGEYKINNFKLEHHKRNLNFLKEIERINVAISRAKSKLILIGYFNAYLNKIDLQNEYGKLFKKYYDEVFESDDSYILLDKGIC
ncbi:MAG: C-terminal helicase domain-containing protein, partial [Ureaplasma sp.]|nr:C-terminal helicase domain-containing protein [Ureaplasma sp.]